MPAQLMDISHYLTGVNPDPRNSKYINFPKAVTGCKASQFGLTYRDSFVAPTADSVSFPFPQLFVPNERLLFGATSVGGLSSSWVYSGKTLYKPTDLSSSYALGSPTGTITSGNPWQVADVMDTWFAFNGNNTVFNLPGYGVFSSSPANANCGCRVKQRLVLGGLSGLISTAYQTAFSSWLEYTGTKTVSLADNYIWYSCMGFDDIYWWFFPWMASAEQYSSIMQQNLSGFIQCPFEGKVQAVKELGNGFMAYGADGCCYFKEDPNTGHFGQVLMQVPGIIGCAVGGDNQQHIFLGSDYNLYRVTADLQISRLGYHTEMDEATPTTSQIICHDSIENEQYISSTTAAYMLTGKGLSKIKEKVTSCYRLGETLYGYTSSYLSASMYLNLTNVDFNSPEPKLLQGIRIQSSSPTRFYVQVKSRNGTAWSSYSSAYTFTADGFANIGLTGVEFDIIISSTSPTSTLDLTKLYALVDSGDRINTAGWIS